jgi:hypothetical protein
MVVLKKAVDRFVFCFVVAIHSDKVVDDQFSHEITPSYSGDIDAPHTIKPYAILGIVTPLSRGWGEQGWETKNCQSLEPAQKGAGVHYPDGFTGCCIGQRRYLVGSTLPHFAFTPLG